ncbi:MAG: hypothetical protein ACK2UK_13980 [Candidatus Promineifilaceae bacterium]
MILDHMRKYAQPLLLLGFTAVFTGYLTVWLRGPGVGLSFLGIEMAEWFKFLGLGAQRDIFYLPPILLGLMLALWTMTWPERNGLAWRAWTVRGLAVLISLLAFPAIEDISGPVREQYMTRVLLIGAVVAVALLSGFWHPRGSWRALPWLLIAILAAAGAILPTWLFRQVQRLLGDILGVPVGTGIGLWLNLFGNLLVVTAAFFQFRWTRDRKVRFPEGV